MYYPSKTHFFFAQSLPGGTSGKESTSLCRIHQRCRFNPWVRKTPRTRKWYPTPVFLLGESHGWRSLVGYSPWGHKESESTEHLSRQNILIHFILLNVYLLIVNHMFSILMVTVGLAMKNTGIISTFKQHLQSK